MAEFDDKLNALLSNPGAMEQIMQMAQSLIGGSGGADSGAPPAPPPDTGAVPPSPPPPPSPPQGAAGGLDFSALSGLGGLDPKLLAGALPILRELGSAQDHQARDLLFALRPYLKPERQDKVERALQLARLFRVGKKFLLGRDRDV